MSWLLDTNSVDFRQSTANSFKSRVDETLTVLILDRVRLAPLSVVVTRDSHSVDSSQSKANSL